MKRKKNKHKATKKIRKRTLRTHSKMIATSAPGGGPPSNPIGILEARPASVIPLEGGHTIEATPSVTHEEKKAEKDSERVAGFIFMCSGKTKPECYRYRVFGLPMGQLEFVKKVKPGAKLFLFDFDLKLLYGVYEATSGGDLDLEPMAFDRKFPSQVRFRIFKECLPIPESVFKKAIEDNYVSRSKFRQELNRKQVRSLVSLYRPIDAIQPSSVALPYETIQPARPAYALGKHLQPTARFPPPGDLYLPWRQHTSSQAIPRQQYESSIPRVQYEQYRLQNHMGQIEPVMESRYNVRQLALPPKGGSQISAEVHQPYFPEEPQCSLHCPYRSVVMPSQPASYAYKELQLACQPHYHIASHDGPAQADAVPLARTMHETLASREANLRVSSVYSYPVVAPAYR
ncbi:DCD domain-containing protein [Psidium guajava]|nr:DCD domain-containing protein [Psidium guajava]